MTRFAWLGTLSLAAILVGCGGASSAGDGSSSGGSSSGGGSTGGGQSVGGSGSGGVSNGTGGEPIPWDEWRACTSDTDCIAIPQGTCCGCVPFGVNVAHVTEARAEFAKFNAAECPPLGCPSQECPPDPVPVCEQGTCGWQPGCSARAEADCATDGECEVYQGAPCGSTTQGFVTCSKPKTAGCDQALTCAVGPYGLQYEFPDSCVPEGWTACPGACN